MAKKPMYFKFETHIHMHIHTRTQMREKNAFAVVKSIRRLCNVVDNYDIPREFEAKKHPVDEVENGKCAQRNILCHSIGAHFIETVSS